MSPKGKPMAGLGDGAGDGAGPGSPNQLPNEVRSVEAARQADAVIDVLTGIPASGAEVVLLKWTDSSSRGKPGWGLLATLPSEDFGIEMVRRKYGPGDYRLYIRVPGVDKADRRDFMIHGQATDTAPAGQLTPAAGASAAVERGTLQLIELQGQVLKNLAESRGAGLDVAALVTALATALKPPPAAPFFGGDIDAALKLMRFIEGQREQGVGFRDMWEMWQKALDAAKDLKGDGAAGGGDALERLGLKFADLLDKMADREARGGQPAAADARRLQLVDGGGRPPAPVRPPAGAPAGPENPPPAWLPFLAPVFPTLMRAAARDDEPTFYAALLLRELPEAADPFIEQLMADADYPNNVLTALPVETARAHKWLAKMLLALKDQFADVEGEGEAEPAREADSSGEGVPDDGPE